MTYRLIVNLRCIRGAFEFPAPHSSPGYAGYWRGDAFFALAAPFSSCPRMS